MMVVILMLTWTGPSVTVSAKTATVSAANKQSQQQQQQVQENQEEEKKRRHVDDDEARRREIEKKKLDRITGANLPPHDTKEGILAFREHRKRQLRNLVRGLRKQLADYAAGQNPEMTIEQKLDMERQLDIYSRKLTMLDVELDDMVSQYMYTYIYKLCVCGFRLMSLNSS